MNMHQHRAIFDRYYNYVYSIVYRILRDCGTAEDVEECTADVFLEVFRRLDTVSPDSLRAYLGTAAKNRAIDMSRRLRREQQHTTPLSDNAPSPEDVAANAEQTALAEALLREIRALGEPDSTILIYRYYYDRSAAEIAEELRMNPAAVRARCSRALKKLRFKMQDE